LKKIACTLLKGWECIPQPKKDNLLKQVQEMTRFIVDLQEEEKRKIAAGLLDAEVRSTGTVGEVIPP